MFRSAPAIENAASSRTRQTVEATAARSQRLDSHMSTCSHGPAFAPLGCTERLGTPGLEPPEIGASRSVRKPAFEDGVGGRTLRTFGDAAGSKDQVPGAMGVTVGEWIR
jgi:hypothetical protein